MSETAADEDGEATQAEQAADEDPAEGSVESADVEGEEKK